MSSRRRFVSLFVALVAGAAALLAGAATSQAAPPYTHHPHLSCNPRADEHSHVVCHGDGYLANDVVTLTLHSQTYSLGTVHADPSGSFNSAPLLLPAGVTGTHTIVGAGRGGATDTASTQIVIVAPGGSGVAGAGASSGSGGLSSTGVAIIGMGLVAAGLIAAGALLLVGTRRRRRALA